MTRCVIAMRLNAVEFGVNSGGIRGELKVEIGVNSWGIRGEFRLKVSPPYPLVGLTPSSRRGWTIRKDRIRPLGTPTTRSAFRCSAPLRMLGLQVPVPVYVAANSYRANRKYPTSPPIPTKPTANPVVDTSTHPPPIRQSCPAGIPLNKEPTP